MRRRYPLERTVQVLELDPVVASGGDAYAAGNVRERALEPLDLFGESKLLLSRTDTASQPLACLLGDLLRRSRRRSRRFDKRREDVADEHSPVLDVDRRRLVHLGRAPAG